MNQLKTILIGQSGGPTAVINCTLAGVIQAGRGQRVLGMRHGIEGLIGNDLVDLSDESDEELDRLRLTPSAALGSCRHKLTETDIETALTELRTLGVDLFLYAGGNDSADTTHRLSLAAKKTGLDTRFIGLPKTIDNDLPEMDHCPGYGSAARFVAIATQEIGTDTVAMRRTDPVRFIEVMGRDAGWLAAAASLGKLHANDAPHMILLPEQPLAPEEILARTQEIHRGLGYVVIVLCENQPSTDGAVLGSELGPEFVDSFGHPYFGSPASYLARRVGAEIGLRARVDSLSRLQRSSIALRSDVDAEEAEALGAAAVTRGLAGESDVMLTLLRISSEPYHWDIGQTPLENIANKQRLLPGTFVASDKITPTRAFSAYARPLIGPLNEPHHRYI